jgi:sulfide:quinone oxidoreductase
MGSRIVILGGGFGGIATATRLRERLGTEHEIVLLDRRDSFYMGLRKLWVLAGQGTLEEGRRRLDALAPRGIRVVRAEITAIEPERRRVETDAGTFEGDFLVVALGAEPDASRVPGLVEHAFNLYAADSVSLAAARVAGMEGGRVVVAVAGLPYKCPPAPYEAVMLLEAYFRERGIRTRIALSFVTLQPMLLPNAGPAGARWIGEQLNRRGIAFHVGRKILRIEQKRLVFEDGALDFDLALVAPPHRAPRVVQESGLAGSGGWVEVDRATLATRVAGVYAIGDVTHIPLANEAALPKAGLFAEAHGERVAAAIAAQLLGGAEPPPFDGRGACFLELGSGRATLVEGDFFATPAPDVRVGEPSTAYLEEKRRFESERLARWFGSAGG